MKAKPLTARKVIVITAANIYARACGSAEWKNGSRCGSGSHDTDSAAEEIRPWMAADKAAKTVEKALTAYGRACRAEGQRGKQ